MTLCLVRRIATLASVVVLSTMCARPQSTSGGIPAEDYSVYTRVVEHFSPSAKRPLIERETAVDANGDLLRDNVLRHFAKEFANLAPETISDFEGKNAHSWSLEPNFQISGKYVLSSRKQLNDFWVDCAKSDDKRCGWDLFYDKYPQSSGIVTLSRVGFNKSGDQALVYIGYRRGWKTGSGWLVLLARRGAQWQVTKAVVVWQT